MAIHHLRKRNAEDRLKPVGLHDIRGSSAIVQLGRIVWAIDQPGTEKKRLTCVKSNLDTLPEPLGFQIESDSISFGNAPEPIRKESAVDKAVDLLLALLRKGAAPADELKQEFEGAGISWYSAEKAKDRLGIVSTRDGMERRWYWSLPAKGQEHE